jgi:ribose transport system substrate-binding protein
MAADELGRQLGGKGKVILVRYAEGSASTGDRETGFLERLKSKWPAIQVISSDQYAGTTRETAKRASENLLNRFGNEVQGIFTPSEGSTFGMLLALQDLGKAGKVVFLGFDATEVFVEAIRKRQLHGIVVQNPMRMGYLAVKTLADHLFGKSVEKRIDTGAMVITLDNIDSPEAKELLYPPLQEFLNP